VWIAANELPLLDALVPFLLARSGPALDEFARWVARRRPPEWILTMLEYLPMTMPTREDLLWRFGKLEDPEMEARRQRILEVLLEASPQTQQQLIDKGIEQGIEQGIKQGRMEGRLTEARAALRRVLARRQLTSSQDDHARIEACTNLATLARWLDRAITAVSVSDALA
jgi:flagellar biosynthesis/type III secretory pathway protein FliH